MSKIGHFLYGKGYQQDLWHIIVTNFALLNISFFVYFYSRVILGSDLFSVD